MDVYSMHLRKSRTDEQAEARGEGDVLARHRKTLTELAERNGHIIAAEYAEVAPGDNLAARPQAQRLLLDVMGGKYAGVYCMALDRLSRGAAEDQAAVMRAFQSSGTLLITPEKVYDFNQAADEDFGELRLMFSRLEHKTIKRRMYAGRERSATDGWFIGNRVPYGYIKVPAQGKDGPTLAVHPEQAEIVREVFQMYADGLSSHKICDDLNDRGIKPNFSDYWAPSTIRSMLKNPVYIGLISWGKRVSRPTLDGGHKRVINPRAILSKGRHEPIVPEPLWDAVQARLQGNIKPTSRKGNELTNPLAGLVRCSRCGYVMQRHSGARYEENPTHKKTFDMLRCHNRQCNQIRARLDVVEEMILEQLDEAFNPTHEFSPAQIRRSQERQKAAKMLQDQIKQAEAQQGRLADFLEQGIYSIDDFISRRNVLSERLAKLRSQLAEVIEPDAAQERLAELRKLVPRSMTISEAYRMAPDAAARNELLHALVESVDYDKSERMHSRHDDPRRGVVLDIKLRS